MKYSGDGETFTAVQDDHTFYTCDGWDYKMLRSGILLPSEHSPGALCGEGESVRFSTSHKAGQQLVIEVHEIQPTSNPPLTKLESLPVPFHKGNCASRQLTFTYLLSQKTKLPS